ncbi:MAG: rhodanese-like domain-containing protein, partial [Limnochordales bacterium]
MTPSKPRTIVSAEWLRQRLGRDDIVIADCRFDLTDPAAGRLAYERDHVPGAVYFDLDKDLSGPVTGRGGRHPLPDMDRFAELLGRRGVGDGVTVICYDDQGGQMAARLWWLLRYAGHDDAAVLDGGYGAWRAAGGPVSAEVPAPAPRRFVPRLRPHMA